MSKPDDDWRVAKTDEPCTGCGECCLALPCNLAAGHNPCIALLHHDGRYWCGLVELNIPDVREHLLIGCGCGATMVPKKPKCKLTKEAQHGKGA